MQRTMSVGGWRIARALGLACALVLSGQLFGGQAWAQLACSSLTGTSLNIPTVIGNFIASAGVTYSNPQTITVVIQGTAGNGTIQFGGGSVSYTGNGTFMVTSNTQIGSTTLKITLGGGGGGGTAMLTCNGSNSSSSTTQSSTTQNANRGQVAAQNATTSSNFMISGVVKNVANALKGRVARAAGGARTCPECDKLKGELKTLETQLDTLSKAEKKLAQELTYMKADLAVMTKDILASSWDETQLADKIDAAEKTLSANRAAQTQVQQSIAEKKEELKQAETNAQDSLPELQGPGPDTPSPSTGPSSLFPRSRWRRGPMSMMTDDLLPDRSLRRSLPMEMMMSVAPQRTTPAGSGGFSLSKDDLIQLAQRPDGPNRVREALGANWNIWAEGRVTGNTDTVAASNSFGFNGSVGADYKLKPWMTVGLSLGVETASSYQWAVLGQTNSAGISAVPYLGLRLDPNVFASVYLGVTGLGYSAVLQPGNTATYGGTRVYFGGSLTGSWQDGPWRFEPTVSITYGSENQTGYTDSFGTAVPGQVIQFGRITAGPEVGYTFRDPDGEWQLEPYLRAQLNVDYATNEQVFLNGLLVNTRGVASGTMAGGVKYQGNGRFSARAEGSYESIGTLGLDAWSAMVHVNWAF
jgi:hypothetical protein